ncbi:Kinase D-interacting substrate [Fusarium oxysporum f. sp. albedinis]|nr:Kinase D-interacting substrate [Fusarium oxysporum f. sp. albedinis]
MSSCWMIYIIRFNKVRRWPIRNRTLIWPGLRGLEFRPVVRIIFAFSPLHHYTLLPEISTLIPSTVVSASFKRS